MSKIVNWYSGKNILITGATGFIGKVVVEKILRSIDDIGTIYIFIRKKKNKTIEERWNEILKQPIFEKIRTKTPKKLDKIKIINANICGRGLEISSDDEKELIEKCNIIFHCAAAVKFDKSLHEIVATNTFGVDFIFTLAERMKRLLSFVNCSTAYSQYYEITMEERFHEPPIDPFVMKKILAKFDEHTINVLTLKILGKHENTYAFSKALSEALTMKHEGKFPIAIARPSIVTSAAEEPLPGWTEGLNGVNGWIYAGGRGVLKTIVIGVNYPRCIIPVDVVSNTLIVLGWHISVRRPRNVEFYNIAERSNEAKTWGQSFADGFHLISKFPFNYSVLHIGGSLKTNKLHNAICAFIYHFIPALLIDIILLLCLQKPFMLKVYKKVKYGISKVHYYINNEFIFNTDNFYNLKNYLTITDQKLFSTDVKQALNEDYFYKFGIGFKKYILKEKLEDLPKAKLFQNVLFSLGLMLKALLCYWVIIYLWNRRQSLENYILNAGKI